MLEDCKDLSACEIILSEAVKAVRLLGEIPLSDSDIEILSQFVRQKIAPNISRGTAYLKTKTPTSFVCFLVGTGRYYDKQAGYWPIVEEKVGAIDINWKGKWGKIFLQFIENHDLPRFDEEKGLAYVTPILAHSCIPDCCIEEFFERVVTPLVNHSLYKPFDQDEALYNLKVSRKINEGRLQLENKTKQHNDRIKTLQKENRSFKIRLEKYKVVASLLTDEEECNNRKIALLGLENAEYTRGELINHIGETTKEIRRLEAEGRRLWKQITTYRKRFQPIIQVEPQIDVAQQIHARINKELPAARENKIALLIDVMDKWGQLSTEPWNDSFGDEILQLPFEQLLDHIKRYHNLQHQLKITRERITSLLASQNEERRPSTIISSIIALIGKALAKIVRKPPDIKPSELQQLQLSNSEIEADLQYQLESIRALFVQLSLEKQLLDNPTIDLHEELFSLKSKYEDYLDAHEISTKLEDQEIQLTEQVKGLVSLSDTVVSGDLNAWVNRLHEMLNDAKESQQIALESQKVIENDIRPSLEAARLEHQRWQADIDKIDKQLAELGDGSSECGLSIVQEFHQFQAKTAQIRWNLSFKYFDLQSLEHELQIQGWDTVKRNLELAISEVENQIHAAKGELKRFEHEFEKCPVQYFGVDEPIRRFLLYGGGTAENFFSDCVRLFALAKSGENVHGILDLSLPNRIIQNFIQWWEYYQATAALMPDLEVETNPATGERFHAPQICFDAALGEIIAKLPTQRFISPDRSSTVSLDVVLGDSSKSIYSGSLKLYNRLQGLVETHSCDNIWLTKPSEKYVFQLTSLDNLIHKWEIPGLSDQASFLAFSIKSNQMIKGDHLPKSPLIIVVNNGMSIHPQDCILTVGDRLFGEWKEYTWYEVDLSTVDEFSLMDTVGQSHAIPLTSEPGSSIVLVGGNQLAGVFSDERPIFDLAPEFVRIPSQDQDALHLMKFSLYWDDENHPQKSKHYQVDELVKIIIRHNESWIDIPLFDEKLLGTNPIGCFTLRVNRSPHLDWRFSFCIIPQLNASFDQEIYPPFHGKIPDVMTKLTFSERCTFKPDAPAKIVSSAGKFWLVQTPVSEDGITGLLLCSIVGGKSINIPITFFIPKLRWRLQGLNDTQYNQWLDEVKEELWLGDWVDAQELFLIVQTPWFYGGDASLIFSENSLPIKIGKVRDQTVRVDLKALEDTLRAGPSLETVKISLIDKQKKLDDISLFTIRTCWLAEKIKCFYYPEGDAVRIDVSWQEKGRAGQIVARLWYLTDDLPVLIQEQLVSQGVQETTFKSTATEIKSGKYLVHLEPYDPWSSKSVCPKFNDQNTVIIEIVTKVPEKAITIRSVSIDEYHSYSLTKGSYRIHIIGKVINQKLPDDFDTEDIGRVLIAPFNENWFVGNLEIIGMQEVCDQLADTNPVKFEFDTQKRIVTSIEDRHGEGAMYCHKCNMLFWSQETNLKHEHKIYGPIEQFGVVWEQQ